MTGVNITGAGNSNVLLSDEEQADLDYRKSQLQRLQEEVVDLEDMDTGINIMDFCKAFNARTQDRAGKVLPVVITYYTDKSYDFVVKTPPVAVQLIEAAKIKGGSAEPNRKKVGEITWDQVRTIAQDKMPDLNCFTVESAMTLVAGTARSMGITVKGEFPGK